MTNGSDPINVITINDRAEAIGLTKREYFAAMAISTAMNQVDTADIKKLAESAILIADAVIHQLNLTEE